MKHLFFFLALYLSAGAVAGPVQRHIERVMPRGGQRGTIVEVKLQGVALENVREAIFYRGGVKATHFSAAETIQTRGLMHGAKIMQEVKCRFEIAEDCPVGVHPFRLRTDRELTTVSTFCVTPYKIITEAESSHQQNDLASQAEKLQPGAVTIAGHLRGDTDCFLFHRNAGERISIEVDSVWLTEVAYGDAENDLAVDILNSDGKLIARNDDSPLHVQDPMLTMIAPNDGDYIVRVRQSVPLNSEVQYLAHIHNNQPQPLHAAIEDNNIKPMPDLVFSGTINEKFKENVYPLKVKEGQRYLINVVARTDGSPLDPKIWIRHKDSQRIEIERDDTSISDSRFYSASNSIQRKELLDPRFMWEPKQSGDYLLGVTDMRGLGGPDSFYRVEVSPAHDEINTYLFARVIDSMQCPRLTALAVPQGNRWTVTLNLKEGLGNSYRGELEVFATGLPDGVELIAPTVAAGQTSVPVQLVAAKNILPQSALIQIQVRPKGNPPPGFVSHCQESFPFLSHSGGRAWHHVVVDRYALAVTEAAPFTIDVTPPQIALIRNGSLDVEVHLTRNGDFQGSVDFQPEWLPGGVSGGPAITIPPGETSAVYTFTAGGGTPISSSKVSLVATTTDGIDSGYYTGVDRVRAATQFFEITVADPHVNLKSQPTALRRGERGQFVWEVEHRRPFEGTATTELLGLPKGVIAVGTSPTLTGDQSELVFELEADDDTLLGPYTELSCEVTVLESGQKIKQRLGRGVLRIDP